jgi:dTDP-4-amino-4,6-dideoxygalactose transaminase
MPPLSGLLIPRHQLPAHSPLPGGLLLPALRHLVHAAADPRPRLAALLCQTHGADQALLLASGTQCLAVALRRAAAATGSAAVALPAFTCFDVATAAVAADLRIALYDVDPVTLGPDLESLRRTLQAGVRIAVVAPLYGMPVDWDSVVDSTAATAPYLIEDAAQGHGATWAGRPLGSFGAAAVLSFARGKGWTGGSGGALLVRDRSGDGASLTSRGAGLAAEVAVFLRAAGQSWLSDPMWYGIPAGLPWLGLGETRYREPRPTRPMTRVAAELLLRSREPALREAETRRARARALNARNPAAEHSRPLRPPAGGTPGALRLPLRLSRGMAGFPDQRLARRLGVAAGYPSTLAELPAVRRRLLPGQHRWVGADALVRELVTLPMHSLVEPGDTEALVGLLRTYCG